MNKLKSSRSWKAFKIYSKSFLNVFNLIMDKIRRRLKYLRFEHPIFEVKTQSVTTRSSTDMLSQAFKYIYLLDEFKSAFHLF